MKTSRLIRIVLALLAVAFAIGASTSAEAEDAGPSWLRGGKADGLATSSLAKAAAGIPQGSHSDVKVKDGKAQVELSGTDPTALAAAVEAKGGTVDVAGAGQVRATVPTDELTALANDPAVGRVAPVRRYSAAATSEGVAAIEADDWIAGGKTGAGVKVAIVDLGFKGYETRLGTELTGTVVVPNNLGTCNQAAINGANADDHGTAVAEIVRDVAPNAELHLICVTGVGDLGPVKEYLKNQNINIANISLVNFFARGDGQGPDDSDAGAVRRSRVEDGVLWVAAAGNHADMHYNFQTSGRQGRYCGGTATDLANSVQVIDNDQFFQVTVPAGKGFSATLRWDAWPVTADDFDLFLVDAPNLTTSTVLASSVLVQDGDAASQPREGIFYDNQTNNATTTYLVIARCTGAANPRFDLFFVDTDPEVGLERTIASGSIAEPATSPYAMAAGASCFSTPGAIEPYSSQGPTIDGRVKPDLTGPDANSTVTFGAAGGCTNGFNGTSAASPHLAGAAALLLGANASLDPAQLQTQLERRTTDRGVQGQDSVFGFGSLKLGPVDNDPTPPAGEKFTPATTPTRILDTRGAIGGHNGKLNANETFDLTIPGPVPSDATAVVLNVTVAEPEGPPAGLAEGFATVYPTGAAQPNSSNLNFEPGALPSNQVVAAIGTGDKVSFFTTNKAHFVVDVNGWFNPSSTSGFTGITPVRAQDTRGGFGLAAGTEREVVLAGPLGVPGDATAVALNVTAVNPAGFGFVTVYPTSATSPADRPNAANLTYSTAQTVPNAVTAKIGDAGKVRFFSSVATDLLVDVVGYYRAGSGASYVPLPAPRRDLDTRTGNGLRPGVVGTGPFNLQVGLLDGLPGNAVAAQLNVTVNQPTGGFVTVYPSGQNPPSTSSLNFTEGQTIPNSVLTKLGDGGRITLRNAQGTAHLISDVSGYYVL